MRKIKFSLVLVLIISSVFLWFAPGVQAVLQEKLTNTTFDTDLSGWSTARSYALNDQFSDTRAAGSVNGTLATDGVNTRTVTDTTNKLSIGSGIISNIGGGPANGNPGIWYPSISRNAGKILTASMNHGSSSAEILGFDAGQSLLPDWGISGTGSVPSSALNYTINVISPTNSTTYKYALVLRNTGLYYFINSGNSSNYSLLWIGTVGNEASLYPSLSNLSGSTAYSSDNIRIPTSTWLPTPLAYSTFTTNGATATETVGPDSQTTPSLNLTGGTVSGGTLSITPTVGNELLTDGGLEAWTSPTNLTNWTETITGSSTLNQEITTIHGGSNALAMNVDVSNSLATFYQNISASVGDWLSNSVWAKTISGSSGFAFTDLYATTYGTASIGTTYTQVSETHRLLAVSSIGFKRSSANTTIYFDDASAKKLTLSSLFSTVSTTKADVIVDANVTLTTNTQAGLVLNLDSTSNPQNFVIAYHDGTNVKLDKAVAGVYTNLISAATTYSAGATLRVIKDGTKYRVYYNNALVGTEQTISDVGIINNTIHGMFSTYSGNTFDNFTVWSRGTGGEFSDAPFEELTATQDATIKRSGIGSVKLVAGGVDANFYQNSGLEVKPYNISAHAYTDGSAITSSDLSLEANGSAITTTYTSVGGGWYRLDGTVTGTGSTVEYGVRVKAGKTVYLDDVSINFDQIFTNPGPSTCSDTSPSSLPTITNISSSSNGTSLTINFTQAADPVTYYALEYGTKSGSYQYGSANIGGKGTTSYTIYGLTSGTSYFIRVRGGNGCATGAWSSEVRGTTNGGVYTPTPTSTPKPVIISPSGWPTVPTPFSTAKPESVSPISFRLSEINWPKFIFPEFHFPTIAFRLPEIKIPEISMPTISFPEIHMPEIKFPTIAINLPEIHPDFTFLKNSVSTIGQYGSRLGIYIKDTAVLGGNSFVYSLKQPQELTRKMGNWIAYSIVSFKEIVMDSSPLRISDVKVIKTTPTTALIFWKTNHLSTSKVNFGTTRDYGKSKEIGDKVHDHLVEITGLTPDTHYFYEVMSQNKDYAYDAWHEFVTQK